MIVVRGSDPDESLARAQESLQNLHGSVLDAASSAFVSVGDTINTDADGNFLRGHGTRVVDGKLMATLCGTVERVNQLISVKPIKTRYTPQAGDVVVARVSELGGKRWKCEAGGRQDAVLALSAVNLPGGVQRRRTNVDELNMRALFEEGDLISAEVQSFFADGSMALHTRSLKYGKLEGGQLVQIPALLIRRLKQHFVTLEMYDVDLILGCNGFVWVAKHRDPPPENPGEQEEEVMDWNAIGSKAEERAAEATRADRESVCRVANAIRVLAALFLPVHPDGIVDVCEASLETGVAIHEMMGPAFMAHVVRGEEERRKKL